MIPLTKLKKDYFINLDKLDNTWIKTLAVNGIDTRAVDKVEIKTFVGDREFMTVLEVQL